jgi:hypothetical protein
MITVFAQETEVTMPPAMARSTAAGLIRLADLAESTGEMHVYFADLIQARTEAVAMLIESIEDPERREASRATFQSLIDSPPARVVLARTGTPPVARIVESLGASCRAQRPGSVRGTPGGRRSGLRDADEVARRVAERAVACAPRL